MAGVPLPNGDDPEPAPAQIIYPYRDEKGALLFEVVRRANHKFRQRRPDGRGGYVWDLKGVRRVIYRLPELIASERSDPVYLCEGEKDVENLRKLGLVATCNPMGAEKWTDPSYAEALRGRRCILLPDNDEPGRKHVRQVALALAGIAAEVITVELPGLGPKEDVSDWIARGGTAADLEALWIGRPPDPSALGLLYGAAAMAAPSASDIIVRGIAHKGSITLIYGKPKSGKSFLATDLGTCVALAGLDWMGHVIRQPGPVLYIACEGHGGFWKRLQAARFAPCDDFVLMPGRPHLIAPIDERGHMWGPAPELILAGVEEIQRTRARLPVMVIIDTVFRSFGSGNVNDSSHMMAYVQAAQRIADLGIAVVLIHHATKGNGTPAGSVALMGAADTLILVEKLETGAHQWRIEEAKDDAESVPRGFQLEVVGAILDSDGIEVTSCRVIDDPTVEPVPARGGRPRKAERTAKALSLLKLLVASEGADFIDSLGHRQRAVQVGVLRERFYREAMPGETQDAKRMALSRWLVRAQEEGTIGALDDWLWVIEK